MAERKKILLIGSGPIIIGQACEFDYSGTQACKSLREEGFEVILVNSNPATIMTDPETADRVYVEPLEVDYVEKIIEKEKPWALIPTLGGQTALNLAMKLHDLGVLAKHNVQLLGASPEAIEKAEDRELFKQIVLKVGGDVAKSYTVKSVEEGLEKCKDLGLPIVLRPSFTLGGSGGGIAKDLEEFKSMLRQGLLESPTSQVLIEESLLGWKEFELEVMRDVAGTFVVICTIENLDPMGVHTGDSVTIAPAMTLSDLEYQAMRIEAKKIIEAVGVATGGANVQFAVHPETGRRIVIEMNPRVSRSSALASKATGFPIAKIAAKLAIGKKLDEILNDITKTTPCSFEPVIDYVVTKIPNFNFEKFPGVKDQLGTQMKSVGEVMAIGRTFKESFGKALASLERSSGGLYDVSIDESKLRTPNSQRIYHVAQALRSGWSLDKIFEITKINRWFLNEIHEIVLAEEKIKKTGKKIFQDKSEMLEIKREGLSDRRIAGLLGIPVLEVISKRRQLGVVPGFWNVDTCSGEFESHTPYFYSSYWTEHRPEFENPGSAVVLGSGPNRIGQGIEFDYSCVQAIRAFKNLGLKTVMINSNPETVSTDYDTSDALFFEPLTEEHVCEVLDWVKPKGVCVQTGGQTPINLSENLQKLGHKILGTSLASLEIAEDREKFGRVCEVLKIQIPSHGAVFEYENAIRVIQRIGFPVMCRPSFVLGGRKMAIIGTLEEFEEYWKSAQEFISPRSPLLIDQYLENASEIDVDLVSDGNTVVIGGILEHIEGAGVHSGDSMGVLPPQKLSRQLLDQVEKISRQMALDLKIIGHLNIQMAIQGDKIFVLEANPRSSRSVPFLSKATGIRLVDLSVRAMMGERLHVTQNWRTMRDIAVKGVVFPFKKFQESDILLGPEMKSTGECMGRSVHTEHLPARYSEALSKAFLSSGFRLPKQGCVFFSIKDEDKSAARELAAEFIKIGFRVLATKGTSDFFSEKGLKVESVNKFRQGSPHCVDMIKSGQVNLVINTTQGSQSIKDSFSIRRSCVDQNIPCVTEMTVAQALVDSYRMGSELHVSPL